MMTDILTAEYMKGLYLGMTVHWINVKDNVWKLQAEVMAFQGISGNHSGNNLGHYLIVLAECMGIVNKRCVINLPNTIYLISESTTALCIHL